METQPIKRTVDIRREMKVCSACGQRFSGEAAFCPFDGTKLEVASYDPLGDPLIGTTIDGRYQVVELLGEGGMGHVYEVRHVALDRRFAMKILRRDLARDEELAARFIQEARATASVRHPNVVEITDFGKMPDGVPYFVMELLVGQTLGEVIKSGGPIPARRAVHIIRQVASALATAHAAGVVHRDLKPDNVFLVGGVGGVAAGSSGDDVRVVDFGAAKIIGSSRVTRQGVVFGTPHYMSPEQASGQPVDHRADLYALGIIMYEMFTGKVPFEADTYMGVLTQHMFVQPPRPSTVHPAARELGAIEEITMVCLAKKPEERYGSMEELAAALDEVVQSKSDGSLRIAGMLSSRPSRPPPSVRYPMADELEPPSLAEMRVAIDSVLPVKRPIPWGWIAGVGAAIVVATVVGAVVARRSAGTESTGGGAGAATASAGVSASAGSSAGVSASVNAGTAASAGGSGGAEAAASAGPSTSVESPAVSATAAAPPAAAPVPVRRATPRRTPPAGIDDVGDPFARKH